MATGNDPILDSLGMAHLGSPKALLGNKGGRLLAEFREFVVRGNMLDMAVGIIVGATFGRVVSSFVSDVLMPPIGLFTGHSDFSNKFINLSGHAYSTLAEKPKPRVQPRSIMVSSSMLCPTFLLSLSWCSCLFAR
jgi:hypothetical protein